jgi:hypothetical protein
MENSGTPNDGRRIQTGTTAQRGNRLQGLQCTAVSRRARKQKSLRKTQVMPPMKNAGNVPHFSPNVPAENAGILSNYHVATESMHNHAIRVSHDGQFSVDPQGTAISGLLRRASSGARRKRPQTEDELSTITKQRKLESMTEFRLSRKLKDCGARDRHWRRIEWLTDRYSRA